MKTVCIYHRIDLDGWMSAAIVKHWFNSTVEVCNENGKDANILDFIGFNYGDDIPDLSEYNKVIMCDISLPKEVMNNIPLSKLIWLDHHISAIKDSESYPYHDAFGIRDTKYAACELTWLHFFPKINMPEIVRLLGRYDCFGHKGTNEEQKVLEFQYGARGVISNMDDAYDYLCNPNYNNTCVEFIHERGKAVYEYLCTDAKQSYKNGFEIEFKLPAFITGQVVVLHLSVITGQVVVLHPSVKFICINKERFNPINFGIDYHADGYDGVACFHYANGAWNFSLYNDNGLVDCSVIAKQFGGGGHKGAAGFRVKDLKQIF